MKVILDIPDNQVAFALKVLKSLSFVKNAKPISNEIDALYDDFNQAAQDVRLHKQGKIKLKSAQELLKEL